MSEPRKHAGGRPATGRRYPQKLFSYGNDEDRRLAEALAAKRDCSVAALIRDLIREAARREKVTSSQT